MPKPIVDPQPTGDKPGAQPGARRIRKINFDGLSGLTARAASELRETEDAVIAEAEQQSKRDRLYVKTRDEIAEKYGQGGRV
jgi:hypothetical protein